MSGSTPESGAASKEGRSRKKTERAIEAQQELIKKLEAKTRRAQERLAKKTGSSTAATTTTPATTVGPSVTPDASSSSAAEVLKKDKQKDRTTSNNEDGTSSQSKRYSSSSVSSVSDTSSLSSSSSSSTTTFPSSSSSDSSTSEVKKKKGKKGKKDKKGKRSKKDKKDKKSKSKEKRLRKKRCCKPFPEDALKSLAHFLVSVEQRKDSGKGLGRIFTDNVPLFHATIFARLAPDIADNWIAVSIYCKLMIEWWNSLARKSGKDKLDDRHLIKHWKGETASAMAKREEIWSKAQDLARVTKVCSNCGLHGHFVDHCRRRVHKGAVTPAATSTSPPPAVPKGGGNNNNNNNNNKKTPAASTGATA